MRIGMAFDADDRQDDDSCRLIRRTAKAHDAPLVRKFDNGAHQPLSSAAGKERVLRCAEPGILTIKRYARLTVCKRWPIRLSLRIHQVIAAERRRWRAQASQG
jgi:hypothetical protein